MADIPGLFRVDPAGPVGAYQTYAIRVRRDTTIVAACEAVGCEAWLHGWRSTFDERIWCGQNVPPRSCRSIPPCGRHAAAYIRAESGRTFTERPGPAGLTEFLFESRQRCFAEHRTQPEVFTRRGGDWRGQTTPTVRHTAAGWVDDFGEHQQRLADQQERG